MKEFLNPDQGYKLVYCDIGETPIPENWIEVPEGATSYNQYTRGDGDNEFFIKLVGDTYCFANEGTSYTWEWYGGSLMGHEFVLWQRETLNDKVASAEAARQSGVFVGAPFYDLPEFNFEAVDDFVESNVEQTLSDRESTYGSFKDVALTTRNLMNCIDVDSMNAVQQEALHMICSKLARITNGDPNHVDSWHDIAGYASLVVKDISENSSKD